MAKVGIQRATELTGRSKSTIQRAMKTGKISYEVDNGRKLIDVSEIERVFGIENTPNNPESNQSATPSFELELQKAKHTIEIERLEMKIKLLEEKLDYTEQQVEDLKAQRDSWQKQAQQVLLTSEYSQKQADERISELQKREEARMKAIQIKRQQELQKQRLMPATVNNNSKANNNSLFKALFTKSKKAS